MRTTSLLCAAALVVACGGSSTSGVAGNPGGLDLTGTWSATWTSRDGEVGHGTMELAQSGAQVSGSIAVDGSPCFANADVTGSLEGDALTGTMTAGGASATFDSTVTASSMSGTYDVLVGGACTGDVGTIVATR